MSQEEGFHAVFKRRDENLPHLINSVIDTGLNLNLEASEKALRNRRETQGRTAPTFTVLKSCDVA